MLNEADRWDAEAAPRLPLSLGLLDGARSVRRVEAGVA